MNNEEKIKIFFECLPSAPLFFKIAGEYLFKLYESLFGNKDILMNIENKEWKFYKDSTEFTIGINDKENVYTTYLKIEKEGDEEFVLKDGIIRARMNKGSVKESVEIITEVEKLLREVYALWIKAEEDLQFVFMKDERFSKILEEKFVKKLSKKEK
jgi:hypothetical protein